MQNIKSKEDFKKDRLAQEDGDNTDLLVPDLGTEDSDVEPADDLNLDDGSELDDMGGNALQTDILPPAVPTIIEPEDNGGKPYMVITNLKKIADQANQLIGMIQTAGKPEEWVLDHVTTSADDIEEVYNYYKYKD